MRTSTLMMFLSVLLLAACSSETPSPTIEAIQPTQAESMATEAPTATAEPAPTELPLTEAPAADPPSEGAYKIVPGESQLKYEVGEVFINDNNRFNLAEGVTTEVSGEILVDRAAPQNSQIGTITADISQFKSDSSRRDNAIRERFLQSSQYPMVTFVPTQIEGLPDSYTEGQEITLKITGDLTIREVTRPVTFDATARLEGDTLFGTATTTILMSDFGFGPISILGMLNTEDDAKVTLTLVARP